jgi:hypothetical protein
MDKENLCIMTVKDLISSLRMEQQKKEISETGKLKILCIESMKLYNPKKETE